MSHLYMVAQCLVSQKFLVLSASGTAYMVVQPMLKLALEGAHLL